MEQMSAEDARRKFADLLNRVGFQGEQILITRHGRPLAKLVPVSEADEQELQAADALNRVRTYLTRHEHRVAVSPIEVLSIINQEEKGS